MIDLPTSSGAPEHGFRAAWRHRRWRLLLASMAVSGAGDWMYATAFAVWLFERTGSATWLAVVITARLLMYVLFGSLGGMVAGRCRRRPLMITLDVVRAVVMLGLAAVIAADGPPLAGTVLVVLCTILTVPYRPAITAATPHVVPESALAAANGAEATVGQLSIFAGPALAALILALGSPAVAILVNAATFAVAAALVAAAGELGGGRAAPAAIGNPGGSPATSGWRVLASTPGVGTLTTLVTLTMFAFGAEGVLHVLVAGERLGRPTEFVGVMTAAIGIGGLVAAPLSGRVAASAAPGPWLVGCAIAQGAPLMLLGLISSPVLALVVLGVEGVGVIVFEVLALTLLQRLARERLAEAYGAQDSLSAAGQLLGSLTAPLFVAVAGLTFACAVAGGALVTFGVLGAGALQRCGRVAGRQAGLVHATADALAQLGLLDGADRPAVEAVAAALTTEGVAAGDVVVAEGAPADDLFVIRSGTFTVGSVAAGTLRTMTTGEWFGEIGVVERRPRTATVVAETSGELWRIPGQAFLDAVDSAGALPDPVRRGIAGRLVPAEAA